MTINNGRLEAGQGGKQSISPIPLLIPVASLPPGPTFHQIYLFGLYQHSLSIQLENLNDLDFSSLFSQHFINCNYLSALNPSDHTVHTHTHKPQMHICFVYSFRMLPDSLQSSSLRVKIIESVLYIDKPCILRYIFSKQITYSLIYILTLFSVGIKSSYTCSNWNSQPQSSNQILFHSDENKRNDLGKRSSPIKWDIAKQHFDLNAVSKIPQKKKITVIRGAP